MKPFKTGDKVRIKNSCKETVKTFFGVVDSILTVTLIFEDSNGVLFLFFGFWLAAEWCEHIPSSDTAYTLDEIDE